MESEKTGTSSRFCNTLDASIQTAISRVSGGISPAAVMLAFMDWYIHLLMHPAKLIQLAELSQENYWYLLKHLTGDRTGEVCPITSPQDRRFADKSWQQYPYTFIYESFLMTQQWWKIAVSDVKGMNKHHENVVDFSIRQVLDMMSPSNSIFLNPEIQQATIDQQGQNFVKGYENFKDDMRRYQEDLPPAGAENFVVGENVAASPGKVVFRNRLIELIQYTPTTETVYAEPILITPAWIMKYYILDLSSQHSLVKYLVDHGHTVFMISWKNPTKKDKNMGMQDYLDLGILASLDVIAAIVPKKKTHLVGYCLGGTLTAIATATLARDNQDKLASMTLLAAQTDFTEPGELGLFIDEAQVDFLESMMQTKGYLDTHQMAGAFQLLRSNDLIWSRMVKEYLLGDRKPLVDLMAWNADATRLPFKMHSEYLRHLFLNNQLSQGKYIVKDRPIALTDIAIPMFVVATERDHVSPWKSVFKINLLTTGDVTFVLTSGGHNVGIVSIPVGKTKRYYRMSTLKEKDRFIDAERWHKETNETDGSWWPAFENWIADHSSSTTVKPPEMGSKKAGYEPILDAPGTYVLEK